MRLLLLISLACQLSAANAVYIAASSAGANDGTSCANAKALSYFNSAANWSATPTGILIGPDTTVHLCGTFTASAGADSYIQAQGNGSSGHPVTVLWETGAVVQAPYFSAAHGGIDVAGHSYITMDGGTNGVIQNTLNGTAGATCPGGTCTNQQTSMLIGGWGSNGTMKNLSTINVYVHVSGDSGGGTTYATLARGASNLTITGNTLSQCDVCIMFEWDGGESNLVIIGNAFMNANQDIQIGPTSVNAAMTNVTVANNIAHDWANWDDPTNSFHHNFFHPFTNVSGASLGGSLLIYGNYCYGDMGNHATSFIFVENNNGGSGGTMASWWIFNNFFDHTSSSNAGSSGLIAVTSDNGYLLNNAIRDAGGTGSNGWIGFHSYGTGWTVSNNVFQGQNVYVWLEGAAISGDGNVYYGSGNSVPWKYHTTDVSSIATWRTDTGADGASVTTDPLLNTNGTLQSGSPAIGLGANLTSLGITALDSDKAGIARPGSGAWDAGAYQYQAPPTGSAMRGIAMRGTLR